MVKYIIVMAGVTYLIRMLPFAFFNKKIKSKFVKNFLYYVPFAVLSAMTFPEILYSTENLASSVIGTVTALVLAYFDTPLILVALFAALTAYGAGILF